MDRGEHISLSVAAVLVVAAVGAWILDRPAKPRVPDPKDVSEPRRPPPKRALPEAPPLYPVGTTTVLSSGLEVTDLWVGTGLPLRPRQIAVLELSAWSTADGRLVDSTAYGPGPTRIRLVPGEVGTILEDGLDWMRVGGERLLSAPPGLDRGSAGSLVLVRLVGILDPPRPPPQVELRELAGFGVADLVVGDGPELEDGAQAVLDYTVWLPGRAEPLDSSLLRANPMILHLGRDPIVWAPALAGLHVGGRRLVRVPVELAFGADHRPPELPEGGELLLEVQLHALE